MESIDNFNPAITSKLKIENEHNKLKNKQLIQEIKDLKNENRILVSELGEYARGFQAIKRLYQEQQEEILINDIASEDSERFIKVLADLVNQGHFKNLFFYDVLSAVIKIDWTRMIRKKGKPEPYIYYLGYKASQTFDLVNHYDFPNNQVLESECPDNSMIRNLIYKVMKKKVKENEKKVIVFRQSIDEKQYGHPFLINTIMIRDIKNNISGVFFTMIHLNMQMQMQEASTQSKQIAKQIKQMTIQLQEFQSSYSKIFMETMEAFKNSVENISWQNQSVNQVINQVRAITERTKVLSFNAAIESARAGFHGKGFAIVSNEIRELADSSQHNINQLLKIIEKIFSGINELKDFQNRLTEYLHKRSRIENNQVKLHEDISYHINNLSKIYLNLQEQFDKLIISN